MKKLFLLLALISLQSVSVFADDTNGNTDNPPVNKIKFEEIRNTDLQRSLPYSVVGWFDYHFVEIEIEQYVGEISVNITNNDGDSIIYESKYLCNNENLIIDISSLHSGLYIVYITINNRLYYGEITIE